jgi:hypothetical protein
VTRLTPTTEAAMVRPGQWRYWAWRGEGHRQTNDIFGDFIGPIRGWTHDLLVDGLVSTPREAEPAVQQ